MGKTLYEQGEGGIRVVSHRQGHVRIPNYVYDLWLPIIGAKGIGVYGVYCRLEREGEVKAITQSELAQACRMGPNTLSKTNELLEELGFIRVSAPTGVERVKHWTTQIDVFDPPKAVPSEVLDKYAHPSGYRALSHWLVAPEIPNSISGNTEQYHGKYQVVVPEISNGNALVEDLVVEDLVVETDGADAPPPAEEADDLFDDLFGEAPSEESESPAFTARDLQTPEGRARAQAHLLQQRTGVLDERPWLHLEAECNAIASYAPGVGVDRDKVLRFVDYMLEQHVPLDLQKAGTVRYWLKETESLLRQAGDDVRVLEQALQKAFRDGMSVKSPKSIQYALADTIRALSNQAQGLSRVSGSPGGIQTPIRKIVVERPPDA